jgi:hypothetical protein
MVYAVYVTGQHVDDMAYRYQIQPLSQPNFEATANFLGCSDSAKTETFAHALNLHDSYSAHILTYCEVG